MRILFYGPNSNPPAWEKALRAALPQADVRVWQEGDDGAADYAVVWRPPAPVLSPHGLLRPDLKAVFNIGAGVDGILQLGAALPDVPIIRLDDAGMGVQMAEYVTHAVMRYFRRFDQYDLQQRDHQWRFLEPHDKATFTVGILGMGLLGQHVASMLAPLGFPLRGWSRSEKSLPGIECFSGQAGLEAFLQGTRVLVCMLPLTTETTGILNRNTLGKLPNGAYLINVARGSHLIDADLLKLVQDGHIAAATLDVFHDEPLPPQHRFWHEPRITITPHMAAITLREPSALQIADKIHALQRGETVTGIVDRMKGY
jgi:glyoxylate/hydroxypyruvate reductase A